MPLVLYIVYSLWVPLVSGLSCRLRSRRMVSTEEHSNAIRSSSSFLGRNCGAESFIQEHAKKGTGSCIAVS